MLSEVLTALKELKSELQDQLARQPEYRALLVLERAASQLGGAVEGPDRSADPRGEGQTTEPRPPIVPGRKSADAPDDPAVTHAHANDQTGEASDSDVALSELAGIVETPHPTADDMPGIAPPYRPPDAAPMVAPRGRRTLDVAPLVATEAREPGGLAGAAPARNLWAVDSMRRSPAPAQDVAGAEDRPATTGSMRFLAHESAREAAGSAAVANISRLAALYESAAEASDASILDEGVDETSGAIAEPVAAPAGAAANRAETRHAMIEASGPVADPAGLPSALYESTGDAPNLSQIVERLPHAPIRPAVVDEQSAALNAFNQTLAEAAKATAHAARPSAPRSFLPVIAAQRLTKTHRY